MKKNRKLRALLLPVLFITGLQAQESVTSGGGDGSGSGGSVNYSVGQVAFTSANNSSGSVNQGVQQAYEVSSVGMPQHPSVRLMSAYPNPVLDELILSTGEIDLQNVAYSLHDQGGRLLRQEAVKSADTKISMRDYANAVYFLKVTDNNDLIHTFQIIKHQ